MFNLVADEIDPSFTLAADDEVKDEFMFFDEIPKLDPQIATLMCNSKINTNSPDIEDTKVKTARSHVEKVLTDSKCDVSLKPQLLLLIHFFLIAYDMLCNSLSLEKLLLHLVLGLVNIDFLHGCFLMLM